MKREPGVSFRGTCLTASAGWTCDLNEQGTHLREQVQNRRVSRHSRGARRAQQQRRYDQREHGRAVFFAKEREEETL